MVFIAVIVIVMVRETIQILRMDVLRLETMGGVYRRMEDQLCEFVSRFLFSPSIVAVKRQNVFT